MNGGETTARRRGRRRQTDEIRENVVVVTHAIASLRRREGVGKLIGFPAVRSLIVGCVALFLCLEASIAYAQSASASAGADHKTVFEIGWAGAWSHAESWQPYGITFAVEKTPIEGLLEIEAGVSVSRSRGTTATSVDFLLRKPWTL